MKLTVKQMLENKGIQVKEGHLENLETRWKGMAALRGDLEQANIDDADISLRNIPGGDHLD